MSCEARAPRYKVLDDFLPEPLALAAAAEWPPPDWSYWLVYDDRVSPFERKRAMERWAYLPEPLRLALARMTLLPVAALLGLSDHLVPDLALRGGGLHDMQAGGKLLPHRDASHHMDCGLERRVNAILYLSRGWRPEWAGGLQLWGGCGEAPEGEPVTVACRFNRLVVFDASTGFHGVESPIACPEDERRISCAVYFYGAPRGPVTRKRALFVAAPGADEAPELERLRKQRAGI